MRLLRPHLLTVATGLVAALPVIAATVHAVAIDWMPLGDRAVIAIRSLDVLSTHPPLLGQYSASSQVLGDPVHSPGPLLYWLLAVPTRIGFAAPAIVMGVLNTALVVGIVALARRRGGPALMFATAIGLALVIGSLEPSLPYDVWNPAAGLLPFALVIFLGWSLACGEWRLLPATALAASFAVQCHLGYAVPIAALLAVAAVFLLRERPPIPRPWLVATLAVVAVCWIAPLAESVIHRPGNFEQIVRLAVTEKETFSLENGAYAAARTIGVPPWWLREPRDTGARVNEVLSAPPPLTAISAAAVALALAGLTALALRRGRRGEAAAGAMAVALLPAVALTTASVPTQGVLFGTVSYSLWWAHPAGLFAHLALGLLAARLLPLRRAVPVRRPVLLRRPVLVAVGAAATVLVALAVVLSRGEDRLEGAYAPGRAIAEATRREAPPRPLYVTGSSTLLAFEFQGAATLALRRRGPRPRSDLAGLGTPYRRDLHPADGVLRVTDNRPPRGRVITGFVLTGVPADAPPRESTRRRIAVSLTGN